MAARVWLPLLALSLPAQAWAVTCDELMNMVKVNVPMEIIVGGLRGTAGPFDYVTYDCLIKAGAPTPVLNEFRRFIAPKPSGPGGIRGTVWNAVGQPMDEVRLVLRNTALPDVGWVAVTEGDGRFEFPELPLGTYSLLVYAEEYHPWLTRLSFSVPGTIDITPVLGISQGREASLGR